MDGSTDRTKGDRYKRIVKEKEIENKLKKVNSSIHQNENITTQL